jgi:heme-degrading monooxygenase HmoA
MIMRTWHGRAPLANPSAYPRYFIDHVLPQLKRIDGFLGATLLRQQRAHDIDFAVETRWASMEPIRAFAGANLDRAVVEPEAQAILNDFDQKVQHYEVVFET